MTLPLPVPKRLDPPDCTVEEFLHRECRHLTTSPTSARHTVSRSRVCIDKAGEYTTVLIILATELYPAYNDRDHVPYWKDGDWKNETWDNVAVAKKRSDAVHRSSAYGVPSDTYEYRKIYRERNKARIAESNRKASRKYQAKVRAAIKAEKVEEEKKAEAEPINMIAEIMAAAGVPGEDE